MKRAIPTILIISLALSACSIMRAHTAADAKAQLVGLSREQILSCMGSPERTFATGGTEVWSYSSGNGRTDTTASVYGSGGFASGNAISTSRYCKVDIVMTGGRVSHVNYSGPTGGLLTQGEQCAFAVQNCVR